MRGFRTEREVRRALFAMVREAVREAIAQREHRALIDPRGDAASMLFLDGARVNALFEATGSVSQGTQSEAARRRRVAFVRRLAATTTTGPGLAVGLRRWLLAPDELMVVGAALATAVVPELSRLIAYLGGDASKPGLTVEAAGALIEPADDGVLAIERLLAPGSGIYDAGLLIRQWSDLPFLRQTLEIHPRVVALAAGAWRPENLPLRVLDGSALGPTHFDEAAAVRIRSVCARAGSEPVFGWVVGPRDAALARDIHRLIAIDGANVVATPMSALMEEDAAPALIREARLAGAAVVVETDVGPLMARDAAFVGRVLDRVAGVVPVYVVTEGRAEPRIPTETGRIVAVASRNDAPIRRAALTEEVGHRLSPESMDEVAGRLPGGPASVANIAGPLALRGTEAPAADTAIGVIAEQVGAPLVGPLSLAPPAPAWAELEVPEETAETVRAAARAWEARKSDELLLVLLVGAADETLQLAARLVADLRLRCLRMDLARLLQSSRGDMLPVLDQMAEAAARGNAILVDDTARASSQARDQLEPLLLRVRDGPGLYVVACSGKHQVFRRYADVFAEVPSARARSADPRGGSWL